MGELVGTPWFLKDPKDFEKEPMTISFRLAFELGCYVKLIELFIAMLLPFQVLTLLSFFNFASSIANLLRVYTRLYPGLVIMGLIGPVCILPAFLYTATNLLQFSSHQEFSSLEETYMQFTLGLSDRSFSSFYQGALMQPTMILSRDYFLLGFLWIFKHLQTAFIVACVAYFTYTYRKAAKFEKNMAPQS